MSKSVFEFTTVFADADLDGDEDVDLVSVALGYQPYTDCMV